MEQTDEEKTEKKEETKQEEEQPEAPPIDLRPYHSAKELEALGLEALKQELLRLGMKCSGTLQQRAERLFSVKTNPRKKAEEPKRNDSDKPKKKKKKKRINASTNKEFCKEITRIEFKIYKLCLSLEEILTNSKQNIEKKLSRTAEEITAELEEEEVEAEVEVESEEEDEVIIGKQNYPVGWDGKPIPYWLYKLHGLGIEYRCEICGNQSYWGRRAFERHFQEWRHAHGMRCLGIPNTRHFNEITKIQDAIDLWQKLKEDTITQEWKPDDEMEFEDREGNVFNKKTYEDLAKQGLLEK